MSMTKTNRKIPILATTVLLAILAFVLILNTVIIPQEKYKRAMNLLAAGYYDEGYVLLAELGDTDAITKNKYDRAAALIKAESYDEAYAMLAEIGDNDTIAKSKYDRAMALIKAESYDAAYALLAEIGDNDTIAKSKYDRAMALIKAESYNAAYALLRQIGDNDTIAKSKYDRAMALIKEKFYVEAYEILMELGDYRDSAEKAELIYDEYKTEKLKNAKVGDSVFFGTYEQDDNTANGKEDIEWLVLEIKDGKALLISKYGLDCQLYNTEWTDVTWETCTLRKWLNADFINAAFTADEKAIIPTVTVSADKNPDYSTDPGNATQDRVFLLSITEANKYFSSDDARACQPTAYAVAAGAWQSDSGNCWWWLRSPGYNQGSAANVRSGGGVNEDGSRVDRSGNAVRPALWIDLES